MCDRIHRRGEEGMSIARVWLSIGKKAGGIKRMDNERDSLGAFHMRIAAFDAGWVNATAEQEAPPTKDGGIDPKGWCANGAQSLHNAHPTYISRLNPRPHKEKGWCAVRTLHKVRRT